jgi:hypothetical protein
MEENELYDRIGETDLNPTYKDGQTYQHTDINQQVSIIKTAVNANYYDIQKMQNGQKTVGNANQLDGATLSRYIDEPLQANDNKIPSSQQTKAYVDERLSEYRSPVRGVDYWTEDDQNQVIDAAAALVSEEVKIEMATFDIIDGKLVINGTRQSKQILEDYTFRLNDNKLEVVSNV